MQAHWSVVTLADHQRALHGQREPTARARERASARSGSPTPLFLSARTHSASPLHILFHILSPPLTPHPPPPHSLSSPPPPPPTHTPPPHTLYSAYTWLFGLACIFSFVCAFGIGANDVANSFASSVGAKALTMGQAILVAAIMEFGGAVLLGASVTDTIKGGITKTSVFEKTPDVFLYGFVCVMLAAAFWDNFACHMSVRACGRESERAQEERESAREREPLASCAAARDTPLHHATLSIHPQLPVSTTHTTVGATVGMALASYGGKAVQWAPRKSSFPFLGGVAPIFMSWIFSPVLAGIFVTVLFIPLRAIVLRAGDKSFSRALFVLPLCVFLTFFVLVAFIIQTGSKNNQWRKTSDGVACAVAAGFAAATALVAAALGWLVLKPRVLAQGEADAANRAAAKAAAAEAGAASKAAGEGAEVAAARRAAAMADVDAAAGEGSAPSAFSARLSAAWANFRATRVGDLLTNNVVSRTMSYGATYKVHDHIETDGRVAELWRSAEVFDTDTERLFRYLQVFTACAMSFAHGSNDVANAMGPFAAVYSTWRTGAVPGSKSTVPAWILALGGAGIVAGLTTYGYKIMAVLAVKSVKMTNSRGFCVELATAMTVVLASRFGLPVSTTQVVCGAVLTMGLMEGGKGVNWRMAGRIAVGWVLTLVVACGVAAGFTAFGLFTPNRSASLAAAAAP